MSDDQPKKSSKKKSKVESMEDEIAREVAKVKAEFANSEQIREIKGEKIRDRVREAKNIALIEAAMEAGYQDAPSIGKKIGMTSQGVHRYAKVMGIIIEKTDAELEYEAREAARKVQEEAEKFNLGLKS